MISLDSVSSLLQVLQRSASTKDLKSLVKLLDIEILKSLGDQKYLLFIDGKELTAFSKQKLTPGEHYFARFELDSKQPTLSHLLKMPKLFFKLPFLTINQSFYDIKTLQHLLTSKEGVANFKEQIAKDLASAPSKEHFLALSHLLLSLNQNIFTLPLFFYDTFAFFQLKKRYNKKTKENFLDFYAFFEHLGALSGIVSKRAITLHTPFEEVVQLLEDESVNLAYPLHIVVMERIAPLYEPKDERVLDIVT